MEMKPSFGEIDFAGWNFSNDQKLNTEMADTATCAFREIFRRDAPQLCLPETFPDAALATDADPLMLSLRLPLGQGNQGVEYEVSLSALVTEIIGAKRRCQNVQDADRYDMQLRSIVKALEKLTAGLSADLTMLPPPPQAERWPSQ